MAPVELSTFETHRDHLMAVAYRMLGSRVDAEDAVQEAWLRWNAAARDEIREPRGWLTTVVGRICLDLLRSARVRREAYVGQWLPEPTVTRLPVGAGTTTGDDPAERVARTDEVSYALLVVLERLTPEQRAAFVLHDVFEVPFDEIAAALATTPAAARQLASRARRAVTADDPPRHSSDLAEQRRALTAFVAAAESGDLDGLLSVLAPDAVAIGDGGGTVPAAPRPIEGALAVARFVLGLYRRARQDGPVVTEQVLVNGGPGLLVEVHYPGQGTLRGTMAIAVHHGRITGIFNQLNPAKLTRVPRPDPHRAR